MGHRLSRIVTRTGDAGTTGLGDGTRVPKDSSRIEAIGAVDELNSTIGVLLAEALPDEVAAMLTGVQHDLFDLGGELSIPGHAAVTDAQVLGLEHVARTVCRRAERALVRLAAAESVGEATRRYLNRLSDLLFVMARSLNRAAGEPDVLWRRDRGRGSG
jgi:cob(I)alamin adenosyltransferase